MCSIGKIPSHRSGNVTLSLTVRHVGGEERRLGRSPILYIFLQLYWHVLSSFQCHFLPSELEEKWQNAKACVDESMIQTCMQPWLDVTFQRYHVVTNTLTFDLTSHAWVCLRHDRNLSWVVLQLDTEHWQLACSGSEIWSWRPKDQSDWSGEENAGLSEGSLYGRRAERQTG